MNLVFDESSNIYNSSILQQQTFLKVPIFRIKTALSNIVNFNPCLNLIYWGFLGYQFQQFACWFLHLLKNVSWWQTFFNGYIFQDVLKNLERAPEEVSVCLNKCFIFPIHLQHQNMFSFSSHATLKLLSLHLTMISGIDQTIL